MSAVQAYTADAAIAYSLDTLAGSRCTEGICDGCGGTVTHLTDQLNFLDITGTVAEGAITSAKSSADQALTTIVSAVTAASTAELVIYAAGGSTSSIVAAVNTLKTDLGVDSSTGGGSSGGGSSGGGSSGAAALAVVALEVAALAVAALAVAALAVVALVEVALEERHPSLRRPR